MTNGSAPSTSPDLPITLENATGVAEDVSIAGSAVAVVNLNATTNINNNNNDNNMTNNNNNQQIAPGPEHSSLIILQPGIISGSGYSSMQLPSFTHYQGKCQTM